MNEIGQIWMAVFALVPSVVFSTVSAIGGRPNGRILKRIIAPFIFVTLILGLSLIEHKFNWWLLSLYATYFISGMIGYGGNSVSEKLIRRTIWSVIRVLACLPLVLISGSYTLMILQAIICLSSTLILGVLNPLPAPKEEFLINFLSVVIVPFILL